MVLHQGNAGQVVLDCFGRSSAALFSEELTDVLIRQLGAQ